MKSDFDSTDTANCFHNPLGGACWPGVWLTSWRRRTLCWTQSTWLPCWWLSQSKCTHIMMCKSNMWWGRTLMSSCLWQIWFVCEVTWVTLYSSLLKRMSLLRVLISQGLLFTFTPTHIIHPLIFGNRHKMWFFHINILLPLLPFHPHQDKLRRLAEDVWNPGRNGGATLHKVRTNIWHGRRTKHVYSGGVNGVKGWIIMITFVFLNGEKKI